MVLYIQSCIRVLYIHSCIRVLYIYIYIYNHVLWCSQKYCLYWSQKDVLAAVFVAIVNLLLQLPLQSLEVQMNPLSLFKVKIAEYWSLRKRYIVILVAVYIWNKSA